MNAFLYLLGATACILWRWMKWIQGQPKNTPIKGFWRDRLATNASSLIISVIVMGAYLSGALGDFVRAIGPQDLGAKIPHMHEEWWAAPIAGFCITFGARIIVKKFSDKIGADKEDE